MIWPRESYSRFLVYGLTCPDTGLIRYVGMSSFGIKRPRSHWRDGIKENNYKANWVRKLKSEGKRYNIVVLCEANDVEEVVQEEIRWIAFLRKLGAPLTNLRNGGDGAQAGYKHTPETIQRMRQAQKGRVITPAAREKIRQANLGKRYSDEYKLKMSKVHGGSPFVDQYGNKYVSQRDAASKLKLSPGNISKVLRGKLKHLKGYVFTFCEL